MKWEQMAEGRFYLSIAGKMPTNDFVQRTKILTKLHLMDEFYISNWFQLLFWFELL